MTGRTQRMFVYAAIIIASVGCQSSVGSGGIVHETSTNCVRDSAAGISCQEGAPCAQGQSCGSGSSDGASTMCTCLGGKFSCAAIGSHDAGGASEVDAASEVDCQEDASCVQGSSCAVGTTECSCVGGQYRCGPATTGSTCIQ